MIDIHAHILPGLDDGAKGIEESIEMCLMSIRDGVHTIVATPHTLNGIYINDRETILLKLRELNEAIKNYRINSELRILPGSDVRLCEDTVRNLDQGRLMTINDGKKYLFLEFPFHGMPYGTEEVIFQLLKRGVTPILTHPERNLEIAQRPGRYFEMIRMGCLGQVTAMSLTGDFGPRIKEVAERLLRMRLIHFISSDAHSSDTRPPILSKALRVAERIIGKEAFNLVNEYPEAVVEGHKLDVPDPILL